MPDRDTRRYAVLLLDATRDKQWREECDTLREADDIVERERHRASGYAVFDREDQEFAKSRNFLDRDFGDG